MQYCCREDKTGYEGRQLVSGVNCVPQDAYREFMNTKELHSKTGGRMYYQMLQSFSPEENITPALAHELALRFAQEQFPGYEVVVATHTDRDHVHSHFVINSVGLDGKKYHSNMESLQQLRNSSDDLCRAYGLSVIEPKTKRHETISSREYRSAIKGQSWKVDLALTIDRAMEMADSPEHFIRLMEWEGYRVLWTADRKYITYTTPADKKCRDNKLHDSKYLKEMMEYEFELRAALHGGLEGVTKREAGTGQSGTDHVHGDLVGSQLASADRCSAAPDTSTERHIGQAEYPYGQGGYSELHESATQNSERARSGDAGSHGAVSDHHAERSEEHGQTDGECSQGTGLTGWEDARAVWQSTHTGAGEVGQARGQALVGQPHSGRSLTAVGAGALGLAVGLTDDDDEDESRIAAKNFGAALGAVADTVLATKQLMEQKKTTEQSM